MEENASYLDLEYKRYLQIMRPYLGQLVDERAIKLCNAWIQRLSNCSDTEKSMRNKYIFVLCYQLSKGVLEEPFLKLPPKVELPVISEVEDSASSSEVEYLVIDGNENNTQVLYNNNRPVTSDTEYQSKDNDLDNTYSDKESTNKASEGKTSNATRNQTILCYTCPELMRACAVEISSDLCDHVQGQDQYEYRANNLIKRLREIKKQNMLLQHELVALKEESKIRSSCESLPKINTATSAYLRTESCGTIKSMKNKLQSVEEDRTNLLHTLESLQDQIDNMQEIKRREIEDMEAKHRMEISKIKTSLRDENKNVYEEKLEQLKDYYENLIQSLKDANSLEIKNIIKSRNEKSSDSEKALYDEIRQLKDINQEINEKLREIEEKKTREIIEKENIIKSKDAEIKSLKNKLDEEKTNFNSIMSKFLEKPCEDSSVEAMKLRAQELEKRLNKMEKSKSKCIKLYEIKFANLQREKHLAECALQLQLVRQRAQVINEIADENQGELNTALDKLETKYKEIIANVQATTIERRMQDEMTLNAIVKAACSCSFRNEVNNSHYFGKTGKHNQEVNRSCDSEISGLLRNRPGANKSYDEESTQGYCLNGEKFGQLLEKVYIPQRDYDPLKK